jgi:transposase
MDAHLPDAINQSVVNMLPEQSPPGSLCRLKSKAEGKPLIPHAIVLKVIWFVLTVGCRWRNIPREMGPFR